MVIFNSYVSHYQRVHSRSSKGTSPGRSQTSAATTGGCEVPAFCSEKNNQQLSHWDYISGGFQKWGIPKMVGI